MQLSKIRDRLARKRRIRAKIHGTAQRPRLSVHRSLLQMSAQLIDDTAGRTIAAASSKEAKSKPTVEGAKKVGELLAQKAKAAGISVVVFDRSGFKYHGRVKALADGAREGGLQF